MARVEQGALVGIIMGSDSDIRGVMQRAEEPMQDFGTPFEHGIKSAHRTPDMMRDYAREAADRGLQVIIAGAGGSAHLPGMVASETTVPVLGVAITKSPNVMNRALGSNIGLPEGKPLATFQGGVGAYNAGLFATRLIAAASRPPQEQRVGIIAASEDDFRVMSRVGDALSGLGLQAGTDYINFILDSDPGTNRFLEYSRVHRLSVLVTASSANSVLVAQIASRTEVPVIGVAVTRDPDVMTDGLYRLVNAEEGEPVAAFQDKAGAFNAGLFAARILALSNPELRQAYVRYDADLRRTNEGKDGLYHGMETEDYLELAADPDRLNQAIEEQLKV